jgi:broad specificity phosphatase PhoE
VLPAGGQIRLDPNLREPHPGEGDGLTRAEFAARYGDPESHADPDRPWAPGGESWNDFVRRVRRTIDEIPTRYPHQTVLSVTHAGFIVQFFRSLFAVSDSAFRARSDADFTGITEWEYDEAGRCPSSRRRSSSSPAVRQQAVLHPTARHRVHGNG